MWLIIIINIELIIFKWCRWSKIPNQCAIYDVPFCPALPFALRLLACTGCDADGMRASTKVGQVPRTLKRDVALVRSPRPITPFIATGMQIFATVWVSRTSEYREIISLSRWGSLGGRSRARCLPVGSRCPNIPKVKFVTTANEAARRWIRVPLKIHSTRNSVSFRHNA